MNDFANDNGTEFDDNDIEGDDDKIEENDEDHEENETQRGGAGFVKQKHGNTLDHYETGVAIPTAAELPELLPTPEEEEVEVRRGKTAEDDEERETKTVRGVAIAKQRFKDKLKAAQAKFGKLPKEPKAANNDNFRPVVSCPLMDQLTRRTFEPDKERRARQVIKARYIRELIDLAEADPLGLSVHLPGSDTSTDFDVQRTGSGKVWFDNGQTLDRRKATINNEDRDERFIGSVRTAKKSLPLGGGGFDLNRDDPFPVRVIAAAGELRVVIAAAGPLWPWLKAGLSENATLTDIGLALGFQRYRAPREGRRIIRLALMAVIEVLDRFNEVKDEPLRTTPLPDKSRGSFLNQTSGPVFKVAA